MSMKIILFKMLHKSNHLKNFSYNVEKSNDLSRCALYQNNALNALGLILNFKMGNTVAPPFRFFCINLLYL